MFLSLRSREPRFHLLDLTDFKEWLRVENGHDPRSGMFCSQDWDNTPRFIRYPRDLANWVHYDDVPSQEFTIACLILIHQTVPCMRVVPDPAAVLFGGSAPFDPSNPYQGSRTQEAFFNFGPFHPLAFLTEVTLLALRAVWFQKYYVHRRLRPEEFGARIHIQKTGQAEYPIHRDILESNVFDRPEFKRRDSFLLPLGFAEGAPPHPSYGGGHSTAVGAQATVLKAFFDETYVLPNTYVASRDGKELVPYTGSGKDELTVGGELNKLAWNVAIGRNMAGVHYRTDSEQSMLLGEKVAIELLEQRSRGFPESGAFNFTKFNGERITINFP
ncbi:MAG: phosphoesterase [Nitrososphaeraceae archaeon]|nr:phosphoesterase [Nitrososphaeraceae archaeon]